MTLRLLLIAMIAAAVVASSAEAVAPDRGSQLRILDRNQALWNSQRLRAYRFRLRLTCECPSVGHPVTVTVRNGRARGATGLERRFDTVPELFGELRRALRTSRGGPLVVRYSVRRGYPRTASIDPLANAIDDEISWTVDRFRSLAP
jgi:hypothetical protein